MERNDGNPNVMYTKFLAYCADSLGQDAPKITKLLGIKYESCSKEIQNSNEMADLLGHTMENMKKEPNRAFVHLKDLVHQLKLWSKVKPVKKTQKSSTVNEGNENFQTNAMSNKDEGKRKYNFPPEDDTESKVSSPCSSSSPIKSDCKVLLVKTELVESQLETLTKKPWHSPSKSYRVSIGDGKFDQASVIHKAQKLPLDLNLQPDPEASIASPSCGSENHTQHKPSSEICFSSRQPHASFSGTMSTSPRKVSTSSSSNSEMVPRSTVILEVGSSSSEVEDIQSVSHSKPDKIDSLKSDALNSKTLESVLNPSTKHAEQTYESCKNQLVFAFDKDSVVPSTSFSNGRGVVHGNEKMLDKVEKPPENSVCLQEEPSQGTPSSGTERYRLLDHLDLSAQSPISTKGFETESCVDSCASTLDPLDVNEPDNLSPQVVEDDFPKVTTVGVCQIPDENPTLHIEQNKSNSMTQKDEPEALELDAGFNGGGSLTNPNSDWETISYGSSQVCSSDTIIDEGSITMPKDDALCGKRCESEQLMQSGDSNEKHQKETISDSGNKSNKGSKVNKPEVTNTDTDCLDQQNPSCALENEKEVSPTGIKLNSKSPAGPCKVPEEKAFAITGVQEESAEDGTCCDVDKQALNIDSDDNGKDTRCAKKTLDNSQGCHSPLTVLSEEDEDEPSRQKEEISLPVKRADQKDVNLKVAEEEKDAAVSAKLPKRAMLVPYLAKADTSVIARKLSKEKLAYRDNPKTRPLLNNSADLKIKDSTDSGAPSSGDEFVSTSKDDAREHKKVPQQKLSPEEEKHQRHVKKLEKLLESLRDEIEKCQNRELSFEDMDAEDSSYIYEDRLKKKFVTVWNKLCEVTKRTVETGRPTERTIKFNSTRYKEINRRLERFLNKTKSFPDIHDVKHVIKMTNTKYKLGLSSPMMQNIAREAFVDIGEMLQSRRHQDFIATFGTRQTDMMRMGSRGMDPYWTDPELRKKLDSNRETAKYNLEKVIAKYTQLQETKGKDDDDDDDDDDEEEEDSDVKETCPKKSVPSKRSHGAGSSRSMKDVSGEQDRFDDVDDEDANQGSICDSPLSSGHKVGSEASTQLRSLTSSSTASAPLTSIDSSALGPSQYLTSARLKTPAAPVFSKVYDDQDKLRLNDVPPIDVDQKQSYLDSVGLLTLSMNPYLHKTEAVSPSRSASAGRAPGQTSYSLPNSPASVITVEDSPAKPPKAKLSAVLADKDRHGELEAGVGASEVSRESGRPALSKSEWTAAGEQPLPGVRKSGHRFVEAVEEIEDQTSDSDSDDKSDNDGQDDDDDDDIITVVSSRGSGGESESETSRGVSPISVVSLDIEDGESNSPAVGSEQGTVPKQEEDLGTDNHREDGSAEKVQMLAALNLMPSPVPCRKKSAASNIESSDIAASPAARPSLEVECSDRTEGTCAERGHQSTELSQEGIVGEAASSQVDKDSVILDAANIKESDCSSEHSNAGEGQAIPKFSCSLFGKQLGGGTSHSLFQPNKTLPYPSCTKGESETTPINQCTIENDVQCGSPAEVGSEEMEMDQPECYIDRVEEEEEEEEGEGDLLTVSSGHTFGALAYAESVQEVVHIDVDDTNTLSGPEEPALLGSSTADIAEDCICLADPVEGTSTAETMQYEGREVDKKSGAGSMCAEQTCTKNAMKLKESMNNSDLLIEDQSAICCRTVISEIGNSNTHDSSSHKDLNKTNSLDSDMTETSLPIKKSTVSDPDPGVKDHTETTGSEVERVTSNCIGSYTEALHVSHNKQAPINVGSVDQETSREAEVKCLSSTSDVTNLKPHEETENDSGVKDRKSIANSNVHSSNKDKFLTVTPNKEHSPESTASDKVGAGDATACSAKDPEHSSLLSKPGDFKEPEGDGGSDTGVTPQAGLSSRAASKGTNLKDDKLLATDEVCNEGEMLVQGKEIDSVDKTSATGSTISEAGLSLSALPEADLEPAEKKGDSDGAREFIADLIGDLVDKVGDVCSVNFRQDAC
ncbi:hypothetical protein EGW08_006306 [Elysia chlorotica]|uniref:Daxx histone-binding domain-containing protein n=1 Tax=Elysia chlorotica TaxID=188477 RepID=A0A3S1BKJ0_ELYCH|nr:hypothetical protein EGW08_006306 [Elysia chlorotica]